MSTAPDNYPRVRQHALGDTLREQRRSRPNSVATVDGDIRLDYRALDARVNRLAAVLRTRGIGEGSRLLWVGQNSFRVLEVLLAAAKIGAQLCPVNWRMTPAEALDVLADFDPALVFWQEAEVGELSRALKAADTSGRLWIQHDAADPAGYEALLDTASDADVDVPIDPALPLLAIYTAAFDGRPNAALLSHTALMLQGMLSMQGQQIGETSSYLVSGPMFHLGVLMGTIATFMAGGACIFLARMDAAELIGIIQRERATHGYIPQPTVEQLRALNKDGAWDVSSLFAKPDMSDWRMPMVMPAGAPLISKFGGYGQTEISGLAVLAWLGGGGAGRPSAFMQVKIADDAGRELGPDEAGEICVRGPLVMCGYHRRDEENARRTRDGWHRTNDLGLRKPDGSLVFVGPKTTMIKSGLENIYPAEVEACLRSHPDVQDVCVIGVPDPTWSQNVKAVVVLKAGRETAPEALIQHARERIASYKKPKLVVFVDALPRQATGMVDRAAVDRDHGGGGYPSVG